MIEGVQKRNPGMSDEEALNTLLQYERLSTIKNILGSGGDVEKLIGTEGMKTSMDISDMESYVETLVRLGSTPEEQAAIGSMLRAIRESGVQRVLGEGNNPDSLSYLTEQNIAQDIHKGEEWKKLTEGDANNKVAASIAKQQVYKEYANGAIFDMLTKDMGISYKDAMLAMSGANKVMAISAEQAENLYEKGYFTDDQYAALKDNGGKFNFSVVSGEDGYSTVVASNVQSGDSAYTDNSSIDNSKVTIERGAETGNASSTRTVATNQQDIKKILEGENGVWNLVSNVHKGMSQYYKLEKQNVLTGGYGVGIGKLIGFSASGHYGKEIQTINTINALSGFLYTAYQSLFDEVNSRTDIPDNEKSAWVAAEVANLNQAIYDKIDDAAAKQAGTQTTPLALDDYFKEHEFHVALESIPKHLPSVSDIREAQEKTLLE